MIAALCKYAPTELFAGFGELCEAVEISQVDSSQEARLTHPNLCGFGKALIREAIDGGVDDLILTNCCDTMRRAFDIIVADDKVRGRERFVYLMGLPHGCGPCQVDMLASELEHLCDAYAQHVGKRFDLKAMQEACHSSIDKQARSQAAYLGIIGVRAGSKLEERISQASGLPVKNLTCLGLRDVIVEESAFATQSRAEFFRSYARALLSQIPCMRMESTSARRALTQDPNLAGIVYHTMKFCDFYSLEGHFVQRQAGVPVLSLESDYTIQATGQLSTRIEAFAEVLASHGKQGRGAGASRDNMTDHIGGDEVAHDALETGALYVGIDSGSTSTDVVVVDESGNVIAKKVVPTGASASQAARRCVDEALDGIGANRDQVKRVVATGYGRSYIEDVDDFVTEITCHAKGAHTLFPDARTIIDIGGQDSKVIAIDEVGNVVNFAMNDKCAAGTGRFLEMMAGTLQVSLEEFSRAGLDWDEDIVISSMCSVFAESEVVGLVAQSKKLGDIVHGLDDSIAIRTVGMVHRVGGEGPYAMTGGVALNAGVVNALAKRLESSVSVVDDVQIAGALGAALIARGLED